MSLKTLSPADVEQFIELGYVKLPQAFKAEQALAVQSFLWDKLAERGTKKDDPATWTKPIVHIKEVYNSPIFQACETDRLNAAIEDLVGPGRQQRQTEPANWGWWPINFSVGAEQAWDVPSEGWHWDGMHFRHKVDAPEQGLLLLCVFSEVAAPGKCLVKDFIHLGVSP